MTKFDTPYWIWGRAVEESTGRPFWKTESHEAAFEAGQRAREFRPVEREEWGVVLDDQGSADLYPTLEEAKEHLVPASGQYLVHVVTYRVEP